jgi:hypothetical protein
MHTERSKLFEETYNNLSDCHLEIKSSELTDFEEDRARKLLNFCEIVRDQFKDDERFSDLFKQRG